MILLIYRNDACRDFVINGFFFIKKLVKPEKNWGHSTFCWLFY